MINSKYDNIAINDIDMMEGHSFEYFCADLLERNGFTNVSVTKGSGDQGIDILASKEGVKYAIQCKNYFTPLSNKPIQEAYAGKTYYNCHVAVVMTNSTFTPGAKELAKSTNVLTWDRSNLKKFLENAQTKNTHKVELRRITKKNITPYSTNTDKDFLQKSSSSNVTLNNGDKDGNLSLQEKIILAKQPELYNSFQSGKNKEVNDYVSVSKKQIHMRKNMKILMILCFVLALSYLLLSFIIESIVIAGFAFFLILGFMFLVLGIIPEHHVYIINNSKLKKKTFIIICISTAFLLFAIIAKTLE